MARRGAPNKKGLHFFSRPVDFYEDDKIFDILERFGPMGVTVYDAILTIVYAQGYYAEMPKDKLARMVVRKIGGRWIKKEAAVQVIDACADIGLLHDALLAHGIITSVRIQKEYRHVSVDLMRRRLYDDKYWLLDEEGEPVLKAAKNRFSSEEKAISSEENPITSEEMHLRIEENRKEKERERESAPAHRYFGRYGNVCMSAEEYSSLAADFGKERADNYIGRLGAHMKNSGRTYPSHEATIRRWILQDEEKERKRQKGASVKPNRFHNFDPVGYDYDAIVDELNQGGQGGKRDGREETGGNGKEGE